VIKPEALDTYFTGTLSHLTQDYF